MRQGKREREKEGEGQGKDCSEQTDCPFSLISHSFFYRKLRSERERMREGKKNTFSPCYFPFLWFLLSPSHSISFLFISFVHFSQSFPPHLFFSSLGRVVSSQSWITPPLKEYSSICGLPPKIMYDYLYDLLQKIKNNSSLWLQENAQKHTLTVTYNWSP